MPVTKGTVNVNSDTTGWNKSHVMDALETVFYNLGMHGGESKTGVPICAKWPGQTANEAPQTMANGKVNAQYPVSTEFNHAGGVSNVSGYTNGMPYHSNRAERYFELKDNGTTSYYTRETWQPTNVNTTTNVITVPWNLTLTDEKPLVFIPSGGDATNIIGGLALAQTVYVIRVSETEIKVAANLTDAQNSQEINLTAAPTAGWGATTKFWDLQTGSENATIETYQGDILNFKPESTGTYICMSSSYDGTKTLISDNSTNHLYGTAQSNSYVANMGTTSFALQTGYWIQSENNDDVESFDKPSNFGQGNVHQGYGPTTPPGEVLKGYSQVVEYCYAHDTNTGQKGVIKILPKISSWSQWWHPYWKVTIPGDSASSGGGGAGKDLKLRVFRFHNNHYPNSASLLHIDVCNVTDGWSNNAVFTIPGEDVGGFATTHDIKFGANTEETTLGSSFQGSADGTCSLHVTNYGSGTSFFQKSSHGHYATLKVRHNASKTYGDSYYSFFIGEDNASRMAINSGAYLETQNCLGINANPTSHSTDANACAGMYGFYDGIRGGTTTPRFDIGPGSSGSHFYRDFCTSSSPSNYKLRINYWRGQSPQDDKFAIIQFVQVINDKTEEFFTFSIPAATWGATAPGIDLDHQYHGSVFTFEQPPNNSSNWYRAIEVEQYLPGFNSGEGQTGDENIDNYTKTMDSSYGYIRNDGYSTPAHWDYWKCNIMTVNGVGDIVTYYRNSDYDGTHSSQDYWRPIKGLPLLNSYAPVPYYMPDDFVMIQVGSPPGLTEFKSGDTITVSGSEKYEIILASTGQAATGLDGVTGNSVIGILFCARTVG